MAEGQVTGWSCGLAGGQLGGARFDDGAGGDNEVQRTMLELINQLDGFDPRGNIKVSSYISTLLYRKLRRLHSQERCNYVILIYHYVLSRF